MNNDMTEDRRVWAQAQIDRHSEAYDLRGASVDQQTLAELLASVAVQLRDLQLLPSAIASCPDCFNDAGTSRDWRALRVGDFRWCNEHYFEPAQNLRALREGPAEAIRAFELLEGLEASNWRGLCERALGRPLGWGEVSALVCEQGITCFAIAESNGGDGGAYLLGPEGQLTFLGVCDRIDARLRFGEKIIRWIDRNEWAAKAAGSGLCFYLWDD